MANAPAKTGNQGSTGKPAADAGKASKPALTPEQKAAAKAERFKKLGEQRVPRLLAALDAVKALGNRRAFNYTDEQAKKITDAVAAKVAELNNSFAGGAGFKL